MSVYKIKSGCLIAITLISVVYSTEDVKATTDSGFSEVLGNISKVNDLIQDLIMNYKQLKKMTKSDLESDYDADKEADLIQEDSKRIRHGPGARGTAISKHGGLVTAMFLSDGETGLEIEEKNEDVKTKHRLKRNKAKKRKEDTRNKSKPAIQPLYSHQPVEDNMDVIKPSTPKHTDKESLNKDAGWNFLKQEKSLKPALDTLRDFMESFSDNPLMNQKIKKIKNALHTVSTPSLAITPSTTFPKFGTILPLQHTSTPSKKHLEPIIENYDQSRIKRHSRQWQGSRKTLAERETDKKTEVLASKVSKKQKRVERHRKKIKTPKTQEWYPESENVLRDEMKTNALRKAYGDSCLRLVLRKCYMACKGVAKETCRGRRICTKDFSANFKKYAIRGCDNEFNNNSASFRVANTGAPNEDGFVDMTRDGYLAMACLPGNYTKEGNSPVARSKSKLVERQKARPAARQISRIFARRKTKPMAVASADTSLNILRDRYEKACQRETAIKCYRACKYATNEACEKDKCKSRKKEAMVKACKKRCQQEYRAREYSDSDDSDSDSSSDSKSSRKKSKEDWRRV